MTIQEIMGNNYGKFFDNTDRQQDPNLPPGHREELDEIQEDSTSMEEKLEAIEDFTTCKHGVKEGDFCNICDN